MNHQEFINELSEIVYPGRVGICSRKSNNISKLVQVIFLLITKNLLEGEPVKIKNFGEFSRTFKVDGKGVELNFRPAKNATLFGKSEDKMMKMADNLDLELKRLNFDDYKSPAITKSLKGILRTLALLPEEVFDSKSESDQIEALRTQEVLEITKNHQLTTTELMANNFFDKKKVSSEGY